ncbi:hypothetical protein [Lentzea sp. E54]|uniref:hypothetical protein n=1 Tax=Lentzea xerophila TaxID=3435883 RepID=UPI003DA2666E
MSRDPVRPLEPGEDPLLGTGQGIGFTLLHNTRPDEHGRFFATRWFMLLFPVVPLGRYHVRLAGETTGGGFTSVSVTTAYQLLGRSRLRPVEILRTYLMFWVVMPVMFVGPIIAGIALQDPNSWDSDENMPLAAGVSILMVVVFLAAFAFWKAKLRPVRHPCE